MGRTRISIQINGHDVFIDDTVTLLTGQIITLNADGTFAVTTGADIEANSFTYTVASSTGVADTGIVTPNTVPCFVAGTMVLTPEGERAVETLVAGDRVITYDDGTQRLRWVGRRRVAATGDCAPILIAKGSFSVDRD